MSLGRCEPAGLMGAPIHLLQDGLSAAVHPVEYDSHCAVHGLDLPRHQASVLSRPSSATACCVLSSQAAPTGHAAYRRDRRHWRPLTALMIARVLLSILSCTTAEIVSLTARTCRTTCTHQLHPHSHAIAPAAVRFRFPVSCFHFETRVARSLNSPQQGWPGCCR